MEYIEELVDEQYDNGFSDGFYDCKQKTLKMINDKIKHYNNDMGGTAVKYIIAELERIKREVIAYE